MKYLRSASFQETNQEKAISKQSGHVAGAVDWWVANDRWAITQHLPLVLFEAGVYTPLGTKERS